MQKPSATNGKLLALSTDASCRYGIIVQKGYQKTGNVVGTVTTKMKGAYLFNDTSDTSNFDGCDRYFNDSPFIVYDPADYVIPPQVFVFSSYMF